MSPDKLAKLVEAWRSSPDASGTRLGLDLAREERGQIAAAFEALPIPVQFVPFDPYPDYAALCSDIASNRRMLVYTGQSYTPLWDELTNWKARAVHDYTAHVQGGADFSLDGECKAFRVVASKRPGLAPLYLSEIVLQAAVSTATGAFDTQKLVIPNDDVTRL